MEKLTTSHVLNHLKSNGEFDKFYESILMQLKNTSSYKKLKQVSSMHIKEALPDPSKSLPFQEGRLEKKKQIAEIGLLALSIDSSMSTILSENLHKNAGSIIHGALKDILGSELKHSPEALIQAPKRLLEARENISKKASKLDKDAFHKSMDVFLGSNNDSNTISETEEKPLRNGAGTSGQTDSHKPARQPVPKKISSADKGRQNQKSTVETSKLSTNSKPPSPSESSRGLQTKRKRKPNSKYVSKNSMSNGMSSRVQELIDVQRDLNIINGTALQSDKSSIPPKKKKSKAN